MKIYFAPNTQAVRIVWLLEELGLPYELEFFKLGDASMRSPAYLAVHPQGRVPTLVDDKVTIFESGAIVQYVLAKYGSGRLTPDVGSKEFPVYLQWFHFAEGMIMYGAVEAGGTKCVCALVDLLDLVRARAALNEIENE